MKITICLVFIFLLFFSSCAVAIISPGISSVYRLNKVGDIRFQEATFYGVAEYDYSAFFIEHEYLETIFDDPSNIYFEGEIKQQSKGLIEKARINRIILFEICYDKEKDINIETDILNYTYKLNKNKPDSIFGFPYVYSYIKKGNRKFRKEPFFVRKKHPHSNEIIRTGTDFVSCYRDFIFFPINAEKKGANEFSINTPRNTLLWFNYEFKNEFEKFWKEPREMGVR